MPVDGLRALTALVAVGGVWVAVKAMQQHRKRAKLPPGPPGYPFLGSVLSFPKDQKWLTFADWAKQYGDLTYLSLLGSDLLIVNSRATLSALFEGKSANISDRPSLYFACELVGWKELPAMMSMGPAHTHHRRLMAQTIGTKSLMVDIQDMVESQVYRFLQRAVNEPERLEHHIRTMSAAIVLAITYGYEAEDSSDKLVVFADKVAKDLGLSLASGAYLVDYFPALRYLPSWFPGGGFKSTAIDMRKDRDKFMDEPYNFVLKKLSDGTARPSFLQRHLDGEELTSEQEKTIKWAATMLYLGGSDTTVSAVYTFVLCMMLHPEAQKKAQAELDAILGVGPARLPTAADRPHLPYVEACWVESLRWHTVAPEGLAHMVRMDDMYAGWHIPAGTFVLPNIWLFAHDPETYTEPSAFRPERYLGDAPELDPRSFVFGIGRRACPGQMLAENTVWTVAAAMLALLDVQRVKGPDGLQVEVKVEYHGGTTTFPKEFPVDIKPRSEKAAALLAETLLDM